MSLLPGNLYVAKITSCLLNITHCRKVSSLSPSLFIALELRFTFYALPYKSSQKWHQKKMINSHTTQPNLHNNQKKVYLLIRVREGYPDKERLCIFI